MLSFGTKKKKRSWRDIEAAEDESPTGGEGGEEGGEEELDEKAIEEELKRVEKEEEEERQRLAKIKAEADARRAARKAKMEEKKAAAAAPAPAVAAPVAAAPAAAPEAAVAETEEDDGVSITVKMCREGRCVRVDNVNFKSTEDDIRMLFEGDAETRSSPCTLRQIRHS